MKVRSQNRGAACQAGRAAPDAMAHKSGSAAEPTWVASTQFAWVCDVCGGAIEQPAAGCIEWLESEGTGRCSGLRLVHAPDAAATARQCAYEEGSTPGYEIVDATLASCVGPDGLMRLLGLLTTERLAPEQVADMIKRLHVPFYEQARPYLPQARRDGLVELEMAPGCYSQAHLSAILRAYQGRRGPPADQSLT